MPIFREPINVSDLAFEKAVERSPIPVLVFFWKGKCPPCERMEPILARLAREYASDLLVIKANVDDTPSASRKYAIEAVPTTVFVKGGREVERIVGEVDEATLRRKVEEVLGRRPASGPVRGGAAVSLGRAQPRAGTGAPGGAQYADAPVHVTDATFQRVVLQSPIPVVVDFWAPWCAPCRMIAPVLEDMAREFAGRLLVAKLNVDENPHTARSFGVMSIPTLIVFRNGQPVDRLVGALPGPVLRERIRRAAGI